MEFIQIGGVKVFGSNGTYALIDRGQGKRICRVRGIFKDIAPREALVALSDRLL